MHFQPLHFDSLDSTNREAGDQARSGATEGVTIVADEQTAGRGRQGRSWTSKKGTGLYMSLILRPQVDARELTLIPLIAAIAVHEVLLKVFTIEADIKWPNDVLVDEKKICGILCEAVDTPLGLAVIVGIGLNLSGDAPENATSIEEESETPTSPDHLASLVVEQIDGNYRLVGADNPHILSEWSRRSSYADGKDVTVDLGIETFTGTTCGLEESGALRVRLSDDSIRIVQAGDVTRLRRSSAN
jgi:BirA family biotin operon repressor/biotin-[acetyl-CoA-carboxylase] ligase